MSKAFLISVPRLTQQLKPSLKPVALAASLLLFCCTSYAESATATAQAQESSVADIAVIGQAMQKQQAEDQADDQVQATATATTTAPRTASTGEEQATTLPALNAPVIDPTQVLSSADHQAITQKILSLYQSGKAQIGVVVVPSTGQQDIFSYSLNIAEKWGLGSAKYDNGILMVVAVNDRRIQILTGYGMEGVLPDIVTAQIIRNQITPAFKEGQYGQGILNGLTEIERVVNLDPEIARQAADQLKEQQEATEQQAQATNTLITRSIIILVLAVFASAIVGKRMAGVGAGVAGLISALLAGTGLLMGLLAGVVLFILISSSIAQGILQAVVSSRGGGGFGGGRGGGGGFSGGGGGFGGGGASGSW